MIEMRDEQLLDRLADGTISEDEWRELSAMADASPHLWREVAITQFEQSYFIRSVNRLAEQADDISVDVDTPPRDSVDADWQGDGSYNVVQRTRAWAGWAVAAMLVLAVAVRFGGPAASEYGPEIHRTDLSATPAQLLEQYLDAGRQHGDVIAEVPTKLLVQSRPHPEGAGYEVVFIRQIIERAVVPDLYEYAGENELGQPQLARFVPTAHKPM